MSGGLNRLSVVRMYVPADLAGAVTRFIAAAERNRRAGDGRDDAVLADYAAGMSLRQIAKLHSISPQGICNRVKRSGIPLRRRRLTKSRNAAQ